MMLPEKNYEIRFIRKDQSTEEVREYASLPEAREILRLFDEPISRELYSQIILSEYDWRRKGSRVVELLDFNPRDKEPDWHKWKIGRFTKYEYHEFDGSGILYGIITKKAEDHAIMEADGMALWIDDDTAGMFS